MMSSMAFKIGSSTSAGICFRSSWAFRRSPCFLAAVASKTRWSTGTRRAARIATRPPSLCPTTATCANLPLLRRYGGVLDKILEAKILRLAEFRFPSSGAALVIPERCDVACCQLRGELLQRAGPGLRPVAVVIGRSRSRDQKRNDGLLDICRRRQHGIDIANANRGLLTAGDSRRAAKMDDCERAEERVNAHVQSIFLASSGSMIGIPSRIG